MDGLHCCAGVLHGGKGLLVDVCGFDGVYLLLEHGYLARCLFERVFVLLFAFEGGAGGWLERDISIRIEGDVVLPLVSHPFLY